MKQSRLWSLIESVTNVVVGYILAVTVQIIAFPLFGLQVSLAYNLTLGLMFTAVSVLRSFTLRRLFEHFRR